MWFETLTGFKEESPENVRRNISIEGNRLKSNINGKEFTCGVLEIPSLKDLRSRVLACEFKPGKLSIREEISDATELHADNLNAGSLFQVASQFNLLEMISPNVTPESGIDGYENDHTQGPACAIAAGSGTIYRNYFAMVNGKKGQSIDSQIDCLRDLGHALGNKDNHLWHMKNGYALISKNGLIEISDKLKSASDNSKDELRQLLRIGIQWDTEITISNSRHTVTQAYCSALPVAYSHHPTELWSDFAQVILEASYEATFCAAILNAQQNGNNRLYLTLIGGGVFGNKIEWIIKAIRRALNIYKLANIEVIFVSYGQSNAQVQQLITEFKRS